MKFLASREAYLNVSLYRAPDMKGVKAFQINCFYSKPCVVDTHKNCLDETILMSTNTIGFRGE